MMKKKQKRIGKIILLLLLLAAVIAAACYTVWIKPKQNQEVVVYKEETVQRGDLTVGVTESGALSFGITSQLYDLELQTEEEKEAEEDDDEEDTTKYLRIEDIYVAVGERIEEGDPVLKFTDSSIETIRKKLRATRTEREIALAEANSEYYLNVAAAELTRQASETKSASADNVYSAQMAQLQTEVQIYTVKISNLYREIDRLLEDLEDAKENLSDITDTYKEALADYENTSDFSRYGQIENLDTYISAKEQYEQAQQKVEDIQNQITQAQESIMDYNGKIEEAGYAQGINELGVKQTYETSVNGGTTADNTYRSTLETLQTSVDSAQEDLEEINEIIQNFEDFVGDGTIYAEGNGIVTQLGYEAGDDLENSGVMVAFASPDEMTISVDVSQEDIVSLSLGDSVDIAFSAYPDETWTGTITSITTTATSQYATTVSYPVTVLVEGDTTKLYGGMTADITFVTDTRDNALYVPRKAIVKENDRTYVYVDGADGEKELTEVTTGLSNGTSVEILSGLAEGDTIYIATVESTDTSGAESETNNTQGTMSQGDGMPENGGMPTSGEMPGDGGMPDMENMPSAGEMPDMGTMPEGGMAQ